MLVLMTYFADPSKEDPVVVKSEKEAGDFEKEIKKRVKAFGGEDCPEYTFEGIRGALAKLSFDGSPMYVSLMQDQKTQEKRRLRK